VRGQQGRILRETEMCLAAAPSVLFQRGGALVRPELAPVKFCDASEGFAPALHGQDVRGLHELARSALASENLMSEKVVGATLTCRAKFQP